MAENFLTRDWTQFDPSAYLGEYYADLGPENRALLRFLVEAYQDLPTGGLMLDFGGGPTVYPLISAVSKVREIHISDFLEANREEVQRWLNSDPRAFDWRDFIRHAIELETGAVCSEGDITDRENQIRSKVTKLIHCDASRALPVDDSHELYDVIVTNFCAESATSDRAQWQEYVLNISSLLKPGGVMIMSTLKGASSYSVGTKSFPAVEVLEEDLIEMLEDASFEGKTIELRSVPADRESRDYAGLIMATAKKRVGTDPVGA